MHKGSYSVLCLGSCNKIEFQCYEVFIVWTILTLKE